MPRISHLAAACALALCAQAAQAQQFSGVISFGDSLSDAGNIGILLSGGTQTSNSFTTNPDPVWSQIVATEFGFTQTASLAGGTNYAYGGACSRPNTVGPPAFTCVNAPSGFSLTTQLGGYLSAPAQGGAADPNALYTVWAGANDLFTALGNPATAATVTASAALNTIGNIQALQNAGANYIVVFNLPNIGATPQFSNPVLFPATAPFSTNVTALSIIHNDVFNSGLATLGDGIIPINVFGLVEEVRNNPGEFGLTNVTGVACLSGGLPMSSVGCSPANYVTPTANQTYFFADGVHPTGAGHALLADVVLATISAPGKVSLIGELPLQVYEDHSNAIGQALLDNKVNGTEVGTSRGFVQAQFGSQDYEASINSPGLSTNSVGLTAGFEYRYSERLSFGAAASYGSSNGDTFGGDVDGKELLGSVFATAHFGKAYIGGVLSLGNSSLDTSRQVNIGPSTRVEEGNASASHKAFELGGGYLFGDSLRHGPFVSVTWQKVGVDAFAEDSGSATAMRYESFDRDSLVGRVGYQLQGVFGDSSVHPTFRIAYASENEDDATFVTAGSTSMNGQFTMEGFAPSDNWIEADLGVRFDFSDTFGGYVGYRGRLSDDNQDNNSYNLGVDVKF